MMCQTPRPKRPKVAAPAKPPPRAGAAPSPAIETVAASADALLAAIPGTPGAGAAPPSAIETTAASTDALLAAIPGTPGAGAAPPPAIEMVAAATLAPANNVPALLKAADALLRTMGSADSTLDIDDVGGKFDDGHESIAIVTAESFYADNGQSVRALVILCHELLHDDGTPAVDIANLPWSKMKRFAIRPKADELKADIIRRWNVLCTGTHPALNESLSKVHKWLEENPTGNGFGREFHLGAVDERLVMAEKAAKETEDELSLFKKKWIGKEPILRLIHALIDDNDIKRAYLVRLNVSSDRMVVDTPASKAASVWWNDPQFSPTSGIIDLHSDFYDPITVDHDVVSDMTPATPEKVKEKWDGLLHELKRGIANWERSGQGDGGYLEEDVEEEDVEGVEKNIPAFGTLTNRTQRALDSREAFFTGKESYLLYLWEVLEWHGLLVLSMQRLNTFAISTR